MKIFEKENKIKDSKIKGIKKMTNSIARKFYFRKRKIYFVKSKYIFHEKKNFILTNSKFTPPNYNV